MTSLTTLPRRPSADVLADRKRMLRHLEDAAFCLLRYDIETGSNYSDADAKCVALAGIQNISLTDAELAEMVSRLEHRIYFAD